MLLSTHHCTEHFALRHKLKSCTDPFLYRSDLVTYRRMLYHPNVCNCTMPYVHRTVPAYAVRYPCLDSRSGCSYTSETTVWVLSVHPYFDTTACLVDVQYEYNYKHTVYSEYSTLLLNILYIEAGPVYIKVVRFVLYRLLKLMLSSQCRHLNTQKVPGMYTLPIQRIFLPVSGVVNTLFT